MNWIQYLACFFGGVFFTNALPHFLCGVMGRAFQTPFAVPPGEGLSSSTVNVLWGTFNFLIAYVVCRAGDFDLRIAAYAGSFGLGMLAMGVLSARLFGRFHGGDLKQRT